ncbi:MAG TPA: phosphoribosylformylglycinamidine cyclo-ligase [Actinomycetota bacterium]|nr:phosphoribosylformylglycinamidine cyclo-ligase [Actinomycetota bacterium]
MDPYRRAGVDLDAAARAVHLIRDIADSARGPEVIEGVGGFAGLYRLGGGRLLAAAADGVGTKVEIARRAGRLDTVGIDLVAMSANDVLCTGAEPLFFLDYVAVERLVPDDVAALVAGVAEGCRRAGCALLGGETAEHAGHLAPGRFDLAGFCVGIVNQDRLLGRHRVGEGDVLLGLASTGLHANGFTLVRRVLDDSGIPLDAAPDGLSRPLAEELLEPTAIYVRPVLEALGRGAVHAVAHITGGGLVENLPRVLPEGLGAELRPGTWDVPPVFGLVQRLAGASEEEMRRVFNLGVGMVVVAPPERHEDAAAALRAGGAGVSVVGRVVRGAGVRFVE